MTRARLALAVALLAAACSRRDAAPAPAVAIDAGPRHALPANAIAVPLVRQKASYSCGDVAVLAILKYWDPARYAATREQALYASLGTTPADGTEPQPMADYFARVGAMRGELRRDATAADLAASIDRGEPVIVDLEAWRASPIAWADDWEDGHYAVLVGYDARDWFFMDPSTDDTYAYVAKGELEARWHDVLRTGEKIAHWAIFVHAATDAAASPRSIARGEATPME